MSTATAVRSPATDPAVRGTMIGGSDAPKVVGVSRWGGPLDVYLEKIGVTESHEDTEAAEWGRILEPVLLRQLAIRERVMVAAPDPVYGTPIIYSPEPDDAVQRAVERADGWAYLAGLLGTLRHPSFSFVGCHLDAVILGPDGQVAELVEAKTASAFRGKEWGEEGTDAMPDDYVIQCQHNSMVASAVLGRSLRVRGPVLIGGQRWQVQVVEPHLSLQAEVLRIERAFWARVERMEAPPADATDQGRRALARLYPIDSGEERVIPTTDPVHALALRLRAARAAKETAEREEYDAANRIREAMGPASKFVGDGWSITWKTTKGRTTTDYEAAFLELAGAAELYGLPTSEVQGIRSHHTKTGAGTRTFRPTFRSPKE